MSKTSGLSIGLNPNVVKEGLDKVVYQEFGRDFGPNRASVLDGDIFNQMPVENRNAVIMEVFGGIGYWGTRAERQDLPEATPSTGDQITFTMNNYANSVAISKNFHDDEMHGVVMQMMRNFGDTARASQERTGMGLFRNGFSTTLTADGAALFSNSHTNLAGDTIDNLGTDQLSESSLNDGIVALAEQKDQGGVTRGHEARTLLVPSALFKRACEITGAEIAPLRSGTPNNDVNVYSSKYNIVVKQSNFLGANEGGSDTAWFLLSDYHQIYRFEREGLETVLVDWTIRDNNDYLYKGEFREEYGAVTYEGAFASNGTT